MSTDCVKCGTIRTPWWRWWFSIKAASPSPVECNVWPRPPAQPAHDEPTTTEKVSEPASAPAEESKPAGDSKPVNVSNESAKPDPEAASTSEPAEAER